VKVKREDTGYPVTSEAALSDQIRHYYISPNRMTISLKSILLFPFISKAVTGSFAVIQSI
jgi:hypothetical protein